MTLNPLTEKWVNSPGISLPKELLRIAIFGVIHRSIKNGVKLLKERPFEVPEMRKQGGINSSEFQFMCRAKAELFGPNLELKSPKISKEVKGIVLEYLNTKVSRSSHKA